MRIDEYVFEFVLFDVGPNGQRILAFLPVEWEKDGNELTVVLKTGGKG
jgi:hypothetical protein